jgi:hypothetical protein
MGTSVPPREKEKSENQEETVSNAEGTEPEPKEKADEPAKEEDKE